ncbi:formate dehydrogenase accessory sulfurtransferase FdhD [Acetobacter indonesiensis]|uniref:formate dehydrogenase accessory sulfurtransferase FdhD n=1 Tax=Acetobacter indonesiensis TaxID=104101 RepID=UPI001FD05E69|nr:formate dehydrogenase accessory sulfurtransferase FdhD [Acetobacter indonesiensis]
MTDDLIVSWDAEKLTDTTREQIFVKLAEETPVGFVFNSVPYAVMMATCQDLEDYAYGFSITERLVSKPESIKAIRVEETDDGVSLSLAISGEDFRRLLQSRRAMTGRTGCGICGSDDLKSLHTHLPKVPQKPPISIAAIRKALAALPAAQTLNAQVRMVHGAAWCSSSGDVTLLREDVGRHNALDKLIGAGIRQKADFSEGFCLITSRCSYEMAQKAIVAGFTTLVAISAPTTRALRLAQDAGLTIVGLARTPSQYLFTGTVQS